MTILSLPLPSVRMAYPHPSLAQNRLLLIILSNILCVTLLIAAPETSPRTSIGSDVSPASILILRDSTLDPGGSIPLWEIPWKFRSGDEISLASKELDDSLWQLITPAIRPSEISSSSWTGVGWFRLRIVIDSSFTEKALGIWGDHIGRVQIFWDGYAVADTLHYSQPQQIFTGGPGDHVLAVRYELDDLSGMHDQGLGAGFFMRIGVQEEQVSLILWQRSEQMFFTAFLLAFAVLHLALYSFSPSLRENLYYAGFLLITAAAFYVDIQHVFLSHDYLTQEWLLRTHRGLVPLTSILFLRFLYSVFYDRCPIQFWAFLGLMLAMEVILQFDPRDNYTIYVYASTAVTIEMVRVLVLAVRSGKPGGRIFTIGFAMVGLFSAYDTLLDLDLLDPIGQISNAYQFGFAGMLIAVSVHLARNYAFTSKRLGLVQADNARKTAELGEARRLQLAMLPEWKNDYPGYDIAFSMQTATEVGGDYYDFRKEKDGSMVIVLGDATGHGMKAGIMVSIVKGLFSTHETFRDLPAFLASCSRTIRRMKLGNLFMGLMVIRIDKDDITVATAGMPPAFVWRATDGSVEEILIKSMPLGSPAEQEYPQQRTRLMKNDALLLMTDGLAERFNRQEEMPDYPRVKEWFRDSAQNSGEDILSDIESRARSWSQGRTAHDDSTLAVVKRLS